jgi:putative hydrolase of the HAD superfamily
MGSTLLRYVRPGNGTWREFETPGIRGIYRYLAEQGHPIPSHEDEFVEAMFARLAEGWQQATGGQLNMRAVDWIAASAAHHNLTLDGAALLEAVRRYARALAEGVVETPGAAETLATLRARGLRTGMISNTIWPGELHTEDLAALGILPHLEHLLFSGDFGIWKPRPEVFHHMLDLLGARPEEAIFVGDSPREDILGAQGVGMRAVWMRSAEFPLGDVRPDAMIAALPELLPIVERWHVER